MTDRLFDDDSYESPRGGPDVGPGSTKPGEGSFEFLDLKWTPAGVKGGSPGSVDPGEGVGGGTDPERGPRDSAVDEIFGEYEDDDKEDDDEEVEEYEPDFSFYYEDKWIIDACIQALRKVAERPLPPRELYALALLLNGLWRLPDATPGLSVSIASKFKHEGSGVTRHIELNEEMLRFSTLEFFDSKYGSDWETSIQFEVGTGWREPHDPSLVLDWLQEFSSDNIIEADSVDCDENMEWLEGPSELPWQELPTAY